ncbi:MAG: hypothetical protein NW237_02640 [Cyanobacteriota bacterium]|nr:hypothetical protein [Cyanobacteriota bacterium]
MAIELAQDSPGRPGASLLGNPPTQSSAESSHQRPDQAADPLQQKARTCAIGSGKPSKKHAGIMTPEQEQWLIQTVQNHDQVITELRIQNSEIREGQAMLAQYFREALDRFDRRTDEVMTEVRELRQDFLNHVTTYHPPTDR